ncbi:MAG: class I tRNA ligase family protein, partial [Eubacteriales bacterium]|nr:class I tRNA ligase family protein [Eubacteriales bacterium]
EEPVFAREEDLPVYPTEEKPRIEKCPKCGNTEFVPEVDVMDTWATSSCTPFLIRELVRDDKAAYDALFPVTLRPNAFEIIRTWDFYSVVKAYYNFDTIPFTDVMISGHGLDTTGRKFSKRLGNYVPSDKLLEQYGSDPIRFWATGATLGQNLRFSEQEVDRGKRTATKLWNVARFISMWSEGYEHSETVPELEYADIWVLKELNKTIKTATDSFEAYTYARSRDEAEAFFWSKVADYYVEFIKYRLSGTDEASKKAALWTMHTVFSDVLKMYAPIMPYITEELYSLLYADARGEKSIHLSSWPEVRGDIEKKDIPEFDAAIIAIDEIRKYKSDNNLSLGAEVEAYAPKAIFDKEKYGAFVRSVMRVKELR